MNSLRSMPDILDDNIDEPNKEIEKRVEAAKSGKLKTIPLSEIDL